MITSIAINWTAVRAFNRVWAPVAQQLSEAEAVDAHFDGGEWSGPAHGRIYERQLDMVTNRVAERFGYTRAHLSRMIHLAEHEACERAHTAFDRRRYLRMKAK